TAASGSAASAKRRGALAADQSSCGATGSRRLAQLIASSAAAGGRRPRTTAVNVCRSGSRSACKSARLIASSSGSPLGIDRHRLGGGVSAVGDAASCCIGIGVVEDVHRLGGPNLQLEVVAAARVVDANPEAAGVGLPE